MKELIKKELRNSNEVVATANGKTYTIKKWMVWMNFFVAIGAGLGFAIDKVVEPILWKTRIENSIVTLDEKVDTHIKNPYIHADYQKRAIEFVPRTEIEKEIKSINEKLDLILKMKRQ